MELLTKKWLYLLLFRYSDHRRMEFDSALQAKFCRIDLRKLHFVCGMMISIVLYLFLTFSMSVWVSFWFIFSGRDFFTPLTSQHEQKHQPGIVPHKLVQLVVFSYSEIKDLKLLNSLAFELANLKLLSTIKVRIVCPKQRFPLW